MKAFLLAAGLGTRLRPLTDRVPKCLVPICGKPLVEYWFELFEQHGVGEVLINMHHLPDQVRDWARGSRFEDRVHFFSSPSCWAVRARCGPIGRLWGTRIFWCAMPII